MGAFKQTTEIFHRILLNGLSSKAFSLFSTSKKVARSDREIFRRFILSDFFVPRI